MMKQTLGKFIQQCVTIDDTELERVLSKFYRKTALRHQVLVNFGTVCKEFYFIVSGGVRVFFLSEKGQEKTNHIALENTIITALSSFITQKESIEVVESFEDSELLYISHDDFYDLVHTSKAFELFYIQLLEIAYITKVTRAQMRMTQTAKERFIIEHTNNPKFLNRLPNKIFASYLDVSQETLSRLKSK